MVTQADLGFSDSEDEGEGNRTGAGSKVGATNLAAVVTAATGAALMADELTRAATTFVLVTASLRCGLPHQVHYLLRDLSRLSSSVSCLGTTLGLLAGLAAPGGAAALLYASPGGGECLGIYAVHLSQQLHLPPEPDTESQASEAHVERTALLASVKGWCARLSSDLSTMASPATARVRTPASVSAEAEAARLELSILTAGVLTTLLAPGGGRYCQAFESVGITGVGTHSKALLQLLRVPSAGTGGAMEALCGAPHDPFQTTPPPEEPTEALVLASFRQFWEAKLATRGSMKAATPLAPVLQQAAGAFASLQGFLVSVFAEGEFDLAAGGWRSGPSGVGQALSDLLADRVDKGWDALRTATDGSALTRPVVPPDASVPALAIYSFTTAEPARLLQAAVLDAQLRPDLTGFSADLVVLLAAAALERWHFLVLCSARALLALVLPAVPEGEAARRQAASPLVRQLACLLCAAPSFWCQPALRGDVGQAIQNAAAALLLSSNAPPSAPAVPVPRELTAAVAAKIARLPIFVINLDRRLDRMRRCLLAAEAHELLLLRVTAVDGKAVEAAETGEGRGGGIIPLTDVLDTWDSRLNSTFDHQCQANSRSPFTISERACAASHLRTWRLIHSIRQQLGLGDAALTASVSASQAEQTATYRECLRWHARDDWYLIFEDDAAVNSDLARAHGSFQLAVRRVVQSAPDDFDILYLGWAMPWGRAAISRANEWLLRTNYAWQLHAYVLRGRAVDKLLAHLPVDAPLDNFVARLIHEDKLVAYAVRDKLVNQEGSYSQRQGDSDINHSQRF